MCVGMYIFVQGSGSDVSCLMWVLRIELRSFEELYVVLTTETFSSSHIIILIFNIVNKENT